MTGKRHDDLDWLAFRYVAAELPAEERVEFEARLEHDQEAREAVGRIVEVTCAVRALDWDAVSKVTPLRRLQRWDQRRSVQWTAALAVGLAVAVLVWGPLGVEPGGRRDAGAGTRLPPGELALVWSNVRTELYAEPDWDDGEGGEETIPPARRPVTAVDEEAGVSTPDWMFAALVAMESETDDHDAGNLDFEGI